MPFGGEQLSAVLKLCLLLMERTRGERTAPECGWTVNHMTISHLTLNDAHTSAFIFEKPCFSVHVKKRKFSFLRIIHFEENMFEKICGG